MTTDTDVEHNVQLLLPLLFEKLPDNNMFLSGNLFFNYLKLCSKANFNLSIDVLPIRVIKLLYQYFKDPVTYVITDKVRLSYL